MPANPSVTHVYLRSDISSLSPNELRTIAVQALAEARLQRMSRHLQTEAGDAISGASGATRDASLPELSWDEVAEHNTRDDCWVAIEGVVYDLSDFLAVHPGGEALVLEAAAGGDATKIFQVIHDPTVLSKSGGALVPKVGRVSGESPPLLTGRAPWGGWKPRPTTNKDACQALTAVRAAQIVSQNPHLNIQPVQSLSDTDLKQLVSQLGMPTSGNRAELLSYLQEQQNDPVLAGERRQFPVNLDNPFPHGQFEHEQLEAVRFQWADYSRLTEPQSGEHETFSQKSKLHVLNVERDWLDCDVKKYASEMSMRHAILTSEEYSDAVYVGQGVGSEAHRAEEELLNEILNWLPRRYPDRFSVQRKADGSPLVVRTLTPGYVHAFCVKHYAETPLKLAALLVQEEFYVMVESEADPDDEQHPSGRMHTLQAGVSIFAFDIHEKVNMAMSEIHNTNVPGWQLQLQQNMNHLFANMEPNISWLRHNWLFQDYEEVLHPYFPWSPHVVATRPDVYPKLPESKSGWWESKDLQLQSAADVAGRISLRVEYQTLRRLPRSRAIAFTVRSYVDPLKCLEAAPGAAAALAANVRRRYKGSFFYFALGRHASQRALLEYLDAVAINGGVPVWKEVPDPWERAAVEDGTWAADADRAEMAGEDGVAVAQSVEGLNAFRADAVSKQAKAMVASSADD